MKIIQLTRYDTRRHAAKAALALLILAQSHEPPHASRHEIPAKFADAPAIMLEARYEWDLVPSRRATVSVHRRLLIRDRAGFDHADQSLFWDTSYSNLESFQARTVRPDGKVIEVPSGLRNEVIAGKQGDREYHLLQFTFPAVTVGSILEWQYTIQETRGIPLDTWTVQEDIPVLESRFRVKFNHLQSLQIEMKARAPRDDLCETAEEKTKGGRTTLEIVCRNVPALELEAYSPPEGDLRLAYQVSFRSIQAGALPVYFRRSMVNELHEAITEFLYKRELAADIASRIAPHSMPPDEKINAIHEWVWQSLTIRDDSAPQLGGGEFQHGNVDEVFREGGGTAKEVTLASLALLREAGIDAEPVLVNDRSQHRFDDEILAGADHLMLRVTVDGQQSTLDPSCRYCPPGLPDWRYCSAEDNAIRVISSRAETYSVGVIPEQFNSEIVDEQVFLTREGTSRVDGHATWGGQWDVTLRNLLSGLSKEGREAWLLQNTAGIIADWEAEVSDPDDLFRSLTADYRYKRLDGARTDDGRLLIRPTDTFSSRIPVPIQSTRIHPVWLPFRMSLRKTIVFSLPNGYCADVDSAWPLTLDAAGLSFQSRWQQGEHRQQLVWTGQLMIRTTGIDTRDYVKAREFTADVRRELAGGLVARPCGDRATLQEVSR